MDSVQFGCYVRLCRVPSKMPRPGNEPLVQDREQSAVVLRRNQPGPEDLCPATALISPRLPPASVPLCNSSYLQLLRTLERPLISKQRDV
jgi:hypothetical protein